MSWANDKAFEAEVLRIARAKWPSSSLSGAVMLDGRERDGIFETEDTVNFIEATTSRSSDKARHDTKKLHQAVVNQIKENPIKGARGWFITAEEPTADQRAQVSKIGKGQVTAVSFAQFQQSIVDVGQYLNARQNHLFGSVLDPKTKSASPETGYIPINLIGEDTSKEWTIKNCTQALQSGKRFVLTGQFGAGKSMTLRQIFFQLRDEYQKGRSTQFPIYINLREHTGQSEAVEVIERHARKIGFDSPSSLVKAWRAKFTILILDGFDELTALGVQRASFNKLRMIRRRALEAVRQIILETPIEVGIITAGRDHFFIDKDEMGETLGLGKNFEILKTTEFTKDQINDLLKHHQIDPASDIPSWLPTKPLLISYLASNGLIKEIIDGKETHDAASSWDYLIDQICDREARIDLRYLDGQTIRKILSRLATYARATDDGLGPIQPQQINRAYYEICDVEPDDQAWLILQRLPGLGIYEIEEDSRKFIDDEMVEIYRSGDIYDFINNPTDTIKSPGYIEAMSQIGSTAGGYSTDVIAKKIGQDLTPSKVNSLYQIIQSNQSLSCISADIFLLCQREKIEIPFNLYIEGVFFNTTPIELDDTTKNISGVEFESCYFESVELDRTLKDEHCPTFKNCVINNIAGRTSENELPKGKFIKPSVENYSNAAQTNSAIRSEQLSLGEKVLLTILRKLFIQSLGGRAETALYRGLDTTERQLVDPITRLLEKNGYITSLNRGDGMIWLPVRRNLDTIKKIIASPFNNEHELMSQAKAITS